MASKPSSPCPFCETPLEIIQRQAGFAIKCPYCHTPLVLETTITSTPFFREADPILDDLPSMAPEPIPPTHPPAATQPAATSHAPHGHGRGLAVRGCYNCGSTLTPVLRSKMSDAGLIVLVVMLMVCFPLFWIGLMMKEEYTICPSCGVRR